MPGGVQARNWFTGQAPPPVPFKNYGDPASFTAAAQTQAGDYDRIMKEYENILSSSRNNPVRSQNVTTQNVSAPTITPQITPYSQSSDVTGSLANLSNLAATGGYSDADIQNIRERGISPIRSIYASAQENVDRQRRLAGGYSPNFSAVQAKMARDEANTIADKTTSVNAEIGQNVASNKLTIAPSWSSASLQANAAKTAADRANDAIINQVNEANAARQMEASTGNVNRAYEASTGNVNRNLSAQQQNIGNQQAAVQGMQSLYGTTPALTQTFGNQVATAASLNQNQQEINNKLLLGKYNLAEKSL